MLPLCFASVELLAVGVLSVSKKLPSVAAAPLSQAVQVPLDGSLNLIASRFKMIWRVKNLFEHFF